MFRGGFLHFLHQSNKYSIGELQTLQLYCVSTVYTTWENLKTHTTAHFETNCQWILMLNAIKARTSPSELFLLFRVCAQNVHPLLANRLPNDLSIGRQHCQWSAARVRSRPQGQHYRRKWFHRQMPTHMADIRRDWLTDQNTDWCFIVIGLSTH